MTVTQLPPPMSLLITDDDPGSRETLRDIFEPEGFRTLLAGSGEEAIEIVQAETVHLAILDMHMPKMTGLEALHIVRQINAMLPAILITAGADRDLVRRAFSAHVYSVIPKPVTKNIVLYTVVRALRRAYGPPPEAMPDDHSQPSD